jgi:SEC-C motif
MIPSLNAPCPCGSKKKYRSCCLKKDNHRQWANWVAIQWGFRLAFGICIVIIGMALFGQFHQFLTTGQVCTGARGAQLGDCGPIAYIKMALSTFSFGIIIFLLWFWR